MTQQQTLSTLIAENHPIPDSAWDYAEAWGELQKAKAYLDALLGDMAEIEEATSSSNEQIQEKMNQIRGHLITASRSISH